MVHLKMKRIGTYQNREVIWVNYSNILQCELPSSDWICMFTSSVSKPDVDKFDKITRKSIESGVLEFKGHGKHGEFLHDCFDETMVNMEVMENHPEISVMTTWHNDEKLSDVFWQCFFATCLPESVGNENIKIICSDLDGINRTNELRDYIDRFVKGWLPNDNSNLWEPVEFDQVIELIDKWVKEMTNEQLEIWNRIAVQPIKWKENEHGKEGNGFWVVGIQKNIVIWYNDIEEGFNISNFTQNGIICEYGTEQDELQWAIRKLKETTP